MDLGPFLDSSPSRTRPILMDLARRQAARRGPTDLTRQWAADETVRPAALDLRTATELDLAALDAAAGYEPVLLSPVAPLGVCSAVAPTSQDRVATTGRTSEVVADPTNVLALECAARLGRDARTGVRLCTAHQVLRMQPHGSGTGMARHFRMFVLVDAGPAEGEDAFEVRALARHVAVFDHLFDLCEARHGYAFPGREAVVRAGAEQAVLAGRVADALAEAVPDLPVGRDPQAPPAYYDGLRVAFGARTGGDMAWIGDGGRFDWVARLARNRRLRFVASAVGLQLMPALFGGR